MKKPYFSVIIPTRKINDFIREAIPHHLKQRYKNFEIIIVTEADEKESFPQTRIIKVGQVPPSAKRNIGAKHARGEIIAFIDDDAYPFVDWLENAAKLFENKEISGIGGPSIVPPKDTFFQKVSSKVYELSSKKTGMRYGKAKKAEIEDWPTCNFLVRKKDFQEVKGFNQNFWGGEDTQFCFLLTKKGKKLIYAPEVSVYHHPRKRLNEHLKQTYFWGLWRGFLTKLYPKQSLRLTFFIPPAFLLWLFAGAILSILFQPVSYIYLASMALYILFLINLGIRTRDIKLAIPVMFVTFMTQISYGLGILRGLISPHPPTKKTLNPAERINLKKS